MDPLRQSPSPCSSRPSSPRTPPCEMLGLVGIEAVLDQLKIKAMKMGFEFNIMVVGQSGLGKSTMVNTLFRSKVWKSTLPGLGVTTPQTLKLHAVTHVIEEKGVKLKLTVIDTPGFGDQINNDKCWDPILGYINAQYEQFLQEELLITRQRHIPDTRVHCCVYFVPPTGHCLRPLDIEFLQRLCRTVNVVPVIARADSLTIEEREAFRTRIQQNLRSHCIDVYPQKCFDEDINDRILNSKIRDRIPFAVVGADREHLVNGKCVLGRKTKWGIIEVENMAHCEFPLLRDLLIRSHLQDLKDITHNVHYENYRVVRLNESHLLPRGPGWVNLAPASEGQLSSPAPFKVYSRTQDNPALAGQLSSAGPYKAYSRAQDNATSAGQLSSPRLSKAYSRVQDDATSAGQLSSPRPSKAYSRAQDNATSGQPSSPRPSKIYSRAQDDYSVAGQLSSPQPSRIYSRAQDNSEDEF